MAQLARPWWSRPALGLILGVRPNSLIAHHQRLVEQAEPLEVVEQGRQAEVERRGQGVLDRREVAGVGVPLELAGPPVVDRHERDPGLDQPAGQQARLAERVPAVGLAHLGRLVADPERGLRGGRGEQVVRPVGELVAAADQRGRGDVAGETVERLDHPPPPLEPVQGDAVGRGQVADPEGFLVRVAPGGERVEGRRQVAARREDRRVGHGHIRRHGPPGVLERLGDHAAEAGVDQGRAGPVAGQEVVRRAVVVGLGRGDAPDQGDPVHHLGQVGEDLADLQARDAVSIGLNSPLMSRGASGLGSKVSMCEAPPASQIRMQCLTLVGFLPPWPAGEGPEPEEVVEPEAERGEHPGLEQGPAARAPGRLGTGRAWRSPRQASGRDDGTGRDQWLKANSRELSRAQNRSSAASAILGTLASSAVQWASSSEVGGRQSARR